jgi:hypothetical protein
MFIQRPKYLDFGTLLASRNVIKETTVTRELKKGEFEEFEFPNDASVDISEARQMIPVEDLQLFDMCELELQNSLLRDAVVPSFHNNVTVSCIEVHYLFYL